MKYSFYQPNMSSVKVGRALFLLYIIYMQKVVPPRILSLLFADDGFVGFIQKGNKVEPLLLHLEKNELRWFRHLHFPEQSNVWTFLARHVVWELEASF